MKTKLLRAVVLLYLGVTIVQILIAAFKGVPATIVGELISLALWGTFAFKFYRRSRQGTLALALLFTMAAIVRPILFHLGANTIHATIAERHRSELLFYADELVVCLCALACFDLWRDLRKQRKHSGVA